MTIGDIDTWKHITDSVLFELCYRNYQDGEIKYIAKISCEGTYILEQSLDNEVTNFSICEVEMDFVDADDWDAIRKIDLKAELKKFKKYVEKILKI